ncbi:MAG: hypothetical protein KAU20_05815 [Nanoarchaeota archaeon]|nr:hypothetical protein [Nanoarchaeota archaeon]
MKIPIGKFTLIDDYREDVGDVGELARSIADPDIRLLHLIRVDKNFNILEGRRRFRAFRDYLKLEELEEGVHFIFSGNATSGTPIALRIQWEENIQRKDFTPKEASQLLIALHNKMKETDKDWTQSATAKLVRKSKGYVSKLLYMAENSEIIEDCETIEEALDKLSKVKAKGLLKNIRQHKVDKIKKEAPKSDKFKLYNESLKLCDCQEGVKGIEDNSQDLIYCDPPFGIDLDDTLDGGINYDIYKDDAKTIIQLLKAMSTQWFRVARENSFIVVWTSFEHSGLLTTILMNAGFKIKLVPFVWVKSNAQAISRDQQTGIGCITEFAVYGYKGLPFMKRRLTSNVLYFPTIKKERVHVAQKSEALHKELLTTFADPAMTVLDCFAGSGSIERACVDLGMKVMGFEKDKDTFNNAISYGYNYYNKTEDKNDVT